MLSMQVSFGSVEALEEMFEEVTASWGLSSSEREAVRGVALSRPCRRRRSRFVIERMTLVLEIDWLLCCRMDIDEIGVWIRQRAFGLKGMSPLDDMVGSTDRLRHIRAMLAMEIAQ